ncbi:organic solute transporter Ostalpha-domain-containing protein [Chiua virens]|nr:organic solute transporter Ostalpha-domain-containing protein [Chiua virens]
MPWRLSSPFSHWRLPSSSTSYATFTRRLSYIVSLSSSSIISAASAPFSSSCTVDRPSQAVFPVNLWRSVIDPSDPYTFLFLKRGILQYVQVKPLLALASLIMKATGTYNEGDFRARSGYLYVSIVYNISICLALWCLAVFWMCVHDDLKPFRPVPKFLCVKGILFFSFWQSIAVSFLVAVGIITRLGPYTDSEHISLGLTDTLICIEMPFFAAAHMYAFSYRDFITPPASATGKARSPIYVARMTLGYALRDAVGLKDLVEDTRTTLRGEGINYRAFEPSEGGMHIGAARDRRIRAGLRYAAGGKHKYWLPEVRGLADDDATAPLFAADADEVVHDRHGAAARIPGDDVDVADEDEYALTFSDALAGADELLYEDAKNYVFGDYLYPVVDVSSEEARRAMWEEEERVVREIPSGQFSRGRWDRGEWIRCDAEREAAREDVRR